MQTFKDLKGEKTQRVLMPQFQQLKNRDLRSSKVSNFMKSTCQENLHEQEKKLFQVPNKTSIDFTSKMRNEPGSPTSNGAIRAIRHFESNLEIDGPKPLNSRHVSSNAEFNTVPCQKEEYLGFATAQSPRLRATYESPFKN